MRIASTALFLVLLGSAVDAGPRKAEALVVTPVPAAVRMRLHLAAFYRKHVDLRGFPILASERTSDYALLEAAYIVEHMLAGRPALLAALVDGGVRCTVMAHDELTTDVPEHKTLEPGRYWDRRARGLGASPARPCVSCAEENLLGYPGDPYATENILVHEFAHAIDLMALRKLDTTFERRLQATYEAAMKAGRWKGLYAAENKEEYWAEGVQSWFNTNRPPDAIHNHVDTRAELRDYDPALARLIAAALGENAWAYVRPRDRTEPGHLRGYDSAKAPRFAWPEALETWYRAYEEDLRTGAGREVLTPRDPGRAPDRSPTSLEETRILFMNRSTRRLRIHWLDHEGKRRPYGEVGAGKSREQSTLVGHVWVLTDTEGATVATFVAGRRPGLAAVK